MDKSILLIVEGAYTERQLFWKMFNVYDLSADYKIYSYSTSIYEFYNQIVRPYEDELEALDVMDALRERYPDKELFQKKYTDILLVFDFDPQAERLHPDLFEILITMQRFFNEATDNGKLFISYPAIEAYRHVNDEESDDEFFRRTVDIKDIKAKKYKKIVGDDTSYKDPRQIDRCGFDGLIVRHMRKAWHITHVEQRQDTLNEKIAVIIEYIMRGGGDVLNKQIAMLKETGSFYVLSTALFFIPEYFGSNYFVKLE
jgi:hypothetical protein